MTLNVNLLHCWQCYVYCDKRAAVRCMLGMRF